MERQTSSIVMTDVVRQRSVCCVDYLDIDVSKYIYETYTPSDRAREWKSLLNDQYKYHLNRYPKNDILKDNIESCSHIGYSYETMLLGWDTLLGGDTQQRVRARRLNFLTYLLAHHKSGPVRRPSKWYYRHISASPYKLCDGPDVERLPRTPGQLRAIQYRRDVMRYRDLGYH
jgi:hypothetical protein